jgi:tRNA pseudouridine55 synthase
MTELTPTEPISAESTSAIPTPSDSVSADSASADLMSADLTLMGPRAWEARLQQDPGEIIPLLPAGSVPPAALTPAEPPKSGILNIDKPAGQTSHDVVAAVRRASGERRVGHAGTLDPMATGVLVVCLGSATRVIEEIQVMPKAYRARVRLGERTSSGDAEGSVIQTRDASSITREAVEAALKQFRGEILQVPPMVSALKHQGKRLYDLARQGIEVERAPRPVTVHALTLSDWEPPEFTLEIEASKGTYVRAIADDLGEALGVGAHLVALARTKVGVFTLEGAERLPRVVEAFVEGWWPTLLYPLDTALLAYAAMVADAPREAALRNGQQIDGPAPGPEATAQVRVYDPDGRFIGLVAWDDVTEAWQPTRIFPKLR